MEIKEIQDAISLARQSVEEADLPERWQDPAFREVLRSLLGAGTAGVVLPVAPRPSEGDGVSSSVGLERLASRLGVPQVALADVFAVEDGDVVLHVANAKIAKTKSKATREIALLIASARQAAGIDESWTEVSHIRETLTQYNRYDTGNFAKYLRDTGDVFNFRGRPVNLLRLTRPGWEEATALVKSLAGVAQ